MTEDPRVNFVMREALFEIYTCILCFFFTLLFIYTLSNLSRFDYEIPVFKYKTGWYSEQQPEQPAHTSRQQLHGKNGYQNFSYVHRSRKHWECKYVHLLLPLYCYRLYLFKVAITI